MCSFDFGPQGPNGICTGQAIADAGAPADSSTVPDGGDASAAADADAGDATAASDGAQGTDSGNDAGPAADCGVAPVPMGAVVLGAGTPCPVGNIP